VKDERPGEQAERGCSGCDADEIPCDRARFAELLAHLCDIDVVGVTGCLDRVVEGALTAIVMTTACVRFIVARRSICAALSARPTSATAEAAGRDLRNRFVATPRARLPVAERPTKRSAYRESYALQGRWWAGKADGIEVRPRDDCELERVRQSFPVRLAVGREREHRPDQRFELECGAHLAEEAGLIIACVPETVWGAGHDHGHIARARQKLLVADLQAEQACDDFEAFALVRMNVRGRDEAVRADDCLDEH
jgi:hypothetical protein